MASNLTLHVVNFKAIASVELRPSRLTILAGSNSSGKSSLIQSVLFFAQSSGERALVINGDLVQLGEPEDILRSGTETLGFDVTFDDIEPDEEQTAVTTSMRFAPSTHGLVPEKFELSVQGRPHLNAERGATCPAKLKDKLFDSEVPLQIVDPDGLGLPEQSFLTVHGLQAGRIVYKASEEKYRSRLDHALEDPASAAYFLDDLFRRYLYVGAESDIPDALRRRWANIRHSIGAELDLSEGERRALFTLYLQVEAPGGWASEPISIGPLGAPSSSQGFFGRPGDENDLESAAARLRSANRKMEAYATSVNYLGPLRDDPRVAYPLGHTVTNLPVGEKGEFTAAYLESDGARWVNYVRPSGAQHRGPLVFAVSEWCKHLGIADDVAVESKGKLGHELKLEVHGAPRDPTAIGVGASQLLPVVVLLLGAEPRSLVLLEQPELHLHPKVQSRLADFLARARPQVRLLVETHSEYLLTRLRLLVAREELSREDLDVLFVRQRVINRIYEDAAGEESVEPEVFSEFRALEISELGDFDIWPDEFFDTLDADAAELAQTVVGKLEARSRQKPPPSQ